MEKYMAPDFLDTLVQETYEYSSNKTTAPSSLDEKSEESPSKTATTSQKFLMSEYYPQSPGIIYFINQSEHTFSVKTFPTHNIKEYVQDSFPRLKIEGEESEKFFYFTTPYLEMAEVISDQISSKRYIKEDNHLFSITDPGPYWWLRKQHNYFKIILRPSSMERDDPDKVQDNGLEHGELIKLGPLGDQSIATRRFKQLYTQSLGGLLNIESFICDEKQIVFKTAMKPSLHFQLFMKMIFDGEEESIEFLSLLERNLNRTLYLYLREISYTRKFWKSIQNSLSHTTLPPTTLHFSN